MTDTALLEKWIAERDAEAFKEITKRYAPVVYGACTRILRNPADAEDVAQECFLALVETRKPPRGSLGAWLHVVATNRSLNRLRGHQRRRERETRFAEAHPATPDPTWDDISTYVDEALADLPKKFQAPLVAHFLNDQTHAEIATALGVPRQTVTYRIGKGIERVRKALAKRGIPLTAVALNTLLAAKAAHAVVPATLTTALGKMALAGSTNTAATLAATGASSGGKLLTGYALKAAGFAVVTAIVATVAIQMASSPPEPPPVTVAPPPQGVTPPDNLAASQATPFAASDSTEDATASEGKTNDTIAPNVASPSDDVQPSTGNTIETGTLSQIQARVAANEALTSLIKLEYATQYTFANLLGQDLTDEQQSPQNPGATNVRAGGRSYSHSTAVWAQDGAKFYWNSDFYYPGDEWSRGDIDASNGEVLKWLSKKKELMQGTISEPDTFDFDMVGPLQLGIRLFGGKLPLSEVLTAECASILAYFDTIKGRRAYVVDIEMPIAPDYFGRFWIEQERGMPVYIEYYRINPDSGEEGLLAKIDSIELHELPNGAWFPIKGIRSVYLRDRVVSEHISVVPRTITLRREDIPDSLFEIQFPEGCQVSSDISGAGDAIALHDN